MHPRCSPKIIELAKYIAANKGGDMNPHDYRMSYLAGMFDGDGSFSLIKKVDNEKRSPLYYPQIQLTAKGEPLLLLIKEEFGGLVFLQKPEKKKHGWQRQDVFYYILQKSGPCKPFLEKIAPHLKLKKDRAEELLRFIDENPFKRGSVRLSDDVLHRRENSYLKMKTMNSEGCLKNDRLPKSSKIFDENEFWAYVAGLMDSDGSFCINGGSFCPMLQLSMIDVRGINYLNQYFVGGRIHALRAKTCSTGMTYRWSTNSPELCERLLIAVIPHLRVKAESAKCLLEFIQTREIVKYRRAGISEKELERRYHYHQKLKCLNKYGVYKPSLIDLEGLEQADRAEAGSDAVHGERLSEMDSKECAIV